MAHDVEGNAHVDSLLAADHRGGHVAVGQSYDGILIPQRARERADAAGPHDRQFGGPEAMAGRILGLVRNTGVEMNAAQRPALLGANRLGQFLRIVVRELKPEGFLGGVEQVLAIEIGQGILGFWLNNHLVPPKK